MNFDKSSRFAALEDVLAPLTDEAGAEPILDVGGYPCDFADFCAGRRPVITADMPACARPDYVQASGAALPFADAAFPIVTSSDTLEHIPSNDRPAFVREAMRCASRAVVIGCPWGHPAVTYCEDALRGLHQMLYPTPHPWLDEHGRHGLPELEDILALLREAGANDVAAIASMPLRPWFYHQAWMVLGGVFGPLGGMPEAAARLLEGSAAVEADAGPPWYRVFYVALKAGLLPASFHKQTRAVLHANAELFEGEMETLRAMAQAFRATAGQLKDWLGDPATAGSRVSAAARDAAGVQTTGAGPGLDEHYVRRLEQLLTLTGRDTNRLRRALASAERRLRRLEGHGIIRVLRRLGLIPPR